MKITKISPLTGKLNTMELDVTREQLDILVRRPRPLIQDIFPSLSASEREFLLTGYTQEDWDKMFAEPPDDLEIEGREDDTRSTPTD